MSAWTQLKDTVGNNARNTHNSYIRFLSAILKAHCDDIGIHVGGKVIVNCPDTRLMGAAARPTTVLDLRVRLRTDGDVRGILRVAPLRAYSDKDYEEYEVDFCRAVEQETEYATVGGGER